MCNVCIRGIGQCIYEIAFLYISVSLTFTFSETDHDLALLSTTYPAIGWLLCILYKKIFKKNLSAKPWVLTALGNIAKFKIQGFYAKMLFSNYLWIISPRYSLYFMTVASFFIMRYDLTQKNRNSWIPREIQNLLKN